MEIPPKAVSYQCFQQNYECFLYDEFYIMSWTFVDQGELWMGHNGKKLLQMMERNFVACARPK